MTKFNPDTPEYHQEWSKLLERLEAWKIAPDDKDRILAVNESLEKVGLIVPIDSNDSDA